LFGMRFFFAVRYIKNARQTSSLPCARNKTHGKDFDARQTRVFPLCNNLKWVSGGGINSPRHPTSPWLTTTEKGSVGRTDAKFSRASVHPVPLPRHIAVEIL
jgi:hypothetical protein